MMLYLKQFAVAACIHVVVIYLCRFVLHGSASFVSGKLRFRLRVAVGILYISLSAILFYLFATVMPLPSWGAVAVWGMALVAVELGYAFVFPYSCYYIAADDDEQSIPPV